VYIGAKTIQLKVSIFLSLMIHETHIVNMCVHTIRVNPYSWDMKMCGIRKQSTSWLRGTVVECQSLTGELSLSCARPAADG